MLLWQHTAAIKNKSHYCFPTAANSQTTDLLRRTAGEGFGVQDCIQLPQNRGKIRVSLDSGQQVVVAPLLFDHGCCLLGQNADLLVAVLQETDALQAPKSADPRRG